MGPWTQLNSVLGVNVCAVEALDRRSLLTSALCNQIMKYSERAMGKESGNTKWRECMGQRETKLCPTEEDGYRGKTKVGTTTQKTKGEELLKKKIN